MATLHLGGSTPFNESSLEVMFSEGRTQEELCFLPVANCTYWAPEGVPLSALGPAANLTKCFLAFANEETQSAAAAAGAGCQVPPATQVYSRLAALPWSGGLHLRCMWLEARSGAVSPHGGKIMILLVFMGHNITSVGGSVVVVVFRGYERL